MRKIKTWILQKIFRKELCEIQNEYRFKMERYERECKYILNSKTKDLEVVNMILSQKNNHIVGEAYNRVGNHVYVVQNNHGISIDFFLYSTKYRSSHPRLLATYQESFGEGEPSVKIEDFLAVDENVGNGTLLMTFFLDYCKRLNIKEINGVLSYVDKEHFDKLEYFYQKNGFVVAINESRTAGNIRYIMNHSQCGHGLPRE